MFCEKQVDSLFVGLFGIIKTGFINAAFTNGVNLFALLIKGISIKAIKLGI